MSRSRISRYVWFRLVRAGRIACLAMLACALPSRAADSTEQWGLFEIALSGPIQTPAVQEQTLQTLAKSPFNKVRFIVLNKRYPGKTNESQYPFEGRGTNVDTARFIPKYFQHFELRVLDRQKLGIEADLILFHPYDQGGTGFDRLSAGRFDRAWCVASFVSRYPCQRRLYFARRPATC